MRSDIAPGATFPDYELPDHENVPRKLAEIQGEDPLILTLARGNYCPKEHQQHLELAANYPKIAVAYTKIATISTDTHHASQEFRASDRRPVAVSLRPRADRPEGPRHPGVHRPRARPDDPPHARAQARAGRPHHLQRLLVLGTSLIRRSLARPTDRHPRDPPRLGSQQTRTARSLGSGRLHAISRMGQALPAGSADVVPGVGGPGRGRIVHAQLTGAEPPRTGDPARPWSASEACGTQREALRRRVAAVPRRQSGHLGQAGCNRRGCRDTPPSPSCRGPGRARRETR